MSKLAYHVGHYKQGQVGAIAGHNFEHRDEYSTHSNPDIDPARSQENFVLVTPASGSLYLDAKSRIHAAVTGRVRSDSNWISETITYPPAGMTDREQLQRYFSDVVAWHRDTFGPENILAAAVHLDETTPHLHLDLTPITQDGRLSTKAIFTRAALTAQQTSLAAYLSGKGWDIQRGEAPAPGQAKKRSRTVRQYKAEAEAQKAELAAELATLGNQKVKAEAALEATTEALAAARATLSTQAVQDITFQKTLLGGIKGLTVADAEAMKKTALYAAQYKAENAQLQAELLSAKTQARTAAKVAANARAEARAELDDERDSLRAELEAERQSIKNERPSVIAELTIAQLQNEVRRQERKVNKLTEQVQALLQLVFEKGTRLWMEHVHPLHQEDSRIWTFSQAFKRWRSRNQAPAESVTKAVAELEGLAGGARELQRGIMQNLGEQPATIAAVIRGMPGHSGQEQNR